MGYVCYDLGNNVITLQTLKQLCEMIVVQTDEQYEMLQDFLQTKILFTSFEAHGLCIVAYYSRNDYQSSKLKIMECLCLDGYLQGAYIGLRQEQMHFLHNCLSFFPAAAADV